MIQRTTLTVLFTMLLAIAPVRAADDDKSATLSPTHPEMVKAKARLDRARERLQSARRELEVRQSEASELQDEMRKRIGRLDVSPDSVLKSITRLESELESLELDGVGAEARLHALQDTIKTVAERAAKSATDDEVLAQLQQAAAAREKAFEREEMLYKQGAVAQAELDNTRAMLAEANVRLAERRQAVAATAGGGALADWNREMLNLSLDAQERRARVEFLKDRLDKLKSGLPLLDKLIDLQEAVPAARKRETEARRAVEDAETTLGDVSRLTPPAPDASSPKPKQ
jgi:hypothetical protein